MYNWQPSLNLFWNDSDLEGIINDAANVLEKIGMGCGHQKTIDTLIEKGEEVRYRNGRIHFSAKQVKDFITAQKKKNQMNPEKEEPEFKLGACWMGLNYCDPLTREIRRATSEEAAQMARFWDARDIDWCIPVNPGDVSPGLTTLAGERIAIKNSRKLGGYLTVLDPEEVRYLRDMFLAAGRQYRLDEQVGISPMHFNDDGLETAWQFMDDPDVKVILSGSIPMAGATCVLHPRTAVVQSLAETVAQDILCDTLGVAGGGLLRVEPFDMQYSTICWGSPEWCLFYTLVTQMKVYLNGRPARKGFMRSIAKQPDAQAMTERTATALWQALHGVRIFGGVGQLCIDEVFSPQQAMLDHEIINYISRIIKGIDVTADSVDPVELIQEGITQETFLGTADTASRFRDFYQFPEMFRHWNLGRWRNEGMPSLLDEAWVRAQEVIGQSDFRLTDEQEKAVDAVYEKGKEYVMSRDNKTTIGAVGVG